MDSGEIRRIRQAYAEYDRDGRFHDLSPGRELLMRERDDALAQVLKGALHRPLSECRVLDLGCGGGKLLDWFHQKGARPENLVGVDLLPKNIEIARRHFPAFTFFEANAESLPFPDAEFDIVAPFIVFSSILDEATATNVAQTIIRILKREGVIVWYDLRYPNPKNPNVQAMTKARIRRLFPGFSLDLQSISLLPPLSDRLGRWSDIAYPRLVKLPVLRSHYLGLLTRSENVVC